MTIRRSMGALAVVAIALLGTACSGDDDSSDTTTTAAEDAPSTPDETTTTLNDDDYAEAIAGFASELEAAGTDLCKIIEVQTAAVPPEPANSNQVEQVIGIYTQLLRSFAAAIPDDPSSAEALNTAADELAAEAEAAGYPADFLTGQTQEEAPAALSSEAFVAATASFSQRAQTECAPATPEGTPEAPTTAAP